MKNHKLINKAWSPKKTPLIEIFETFLRRLDLRVYSVLFSKLYRIDYTQRFNYRLTKAGGGGHLPKNMNGGHKIVNGCYIEENYIEFYASFRI